VGSGLPYHSRDTPFRSRVGRQIPGLEFAGWRRTMATATNRNLRNAQATTRKNGSHTRVAAEFAAGSLELESELSAIGTAVPARAWTKVPTDYFANLDHYLHGAPKKK
jgi:hypothetical protein